MDPQLRGTEYLVAALEEPAWRIDADELAVGLRDRWPAVRIGLGAVEGFLPGEEGVHLIEPGTTRTVELTDGLTVEELLSRMS